MICKNADGSYTISASDPTQTYQEIEFFVTFDSISEVVNAENGARCEINGNRVKFKINTKNACGATFDITVR